MTNPDNDSPLVSDYVVDDLIPVVDPVRRAALSRAVNEALKGAGYRGHEFGGAQIDMRIGAVWDRKGDYVGGSLSPTLSPYRTSGEEVYVQISLLIGRDSITGPLAEFITEQQREVISRS